MKSGYDVLDQLQHSTTAVFLDFDGTLTEIVERPDGVSVAPSLLANLTRLQEILDGALAIITGREISAIDRFFDPHMFVVSGVHGYETRTGNAALHRLPMDATALAALTERLRPIQRQHDGLILEEKAASVALHYRLRPDLADLCREAVANALEAPGSLRVLNGKAVIEIKAHGGNKGTAIEYLSRTPPFTNRMPVFIGDDITDEAAFTFVNASDGISIKVGSGPTAAPYTLDDPAAVRAWLCQLANQFAADGDKRTCFRT